MTFDRFSLKDGHELGNGIIVSRADLERAWTAYGFMQFCGTIHDTKIGVVTHDFWTLGCEFKVGDILFYREYKTALCIAMPLPAEKLGESGFIATCSTIFPFPKHYVSPIDPKSVIDIT